MNTPPLPSQDFCLIRHGETTANADAIIAGVTDVQLTQLGRDQARALSHTTWPEQIAIYASPMSRAQDTARLAFPGQHFKLHNGLRERDWGVFEGKPLTAQPLREDTPDQGESWSDMIMRVHAAITEICTTSQGKMPILVCHSGIIRAVRILWTTGDAGQRPPNATPLLFTQTDSKMMEKPL
ncbi:histidine phosphatase family protein [Sulfitobacter guttiformis]|uniref:Putative phosphoglycerate mutase n=1 Tax=Sulfitobacter guttiformis TaxID=74349 RepID=A0A420DSD0_9RHOB|nr:histidine phosphatase family protein [Sulfitobacter guttiformis]KIN74485.1 putative phosphoglycerate mutase [Sulfitobacter guttiformis KCTC 32187]RKE97078.1 putative phosphoglycerate mutase [Sulfitobacter guttiformis]